MHLLYQRTKARFPENTSIRIFRETEQSGGLPVTESTKDVILRIVQAVSDHGNRQDRTRLVQNQEAANILLT